MAEQADAPVAIRDPHSSIAGPLLAVAIIALCVLPFTLYNARTFNDFLLLNSNGGYWLFSSNHPEQGTSFDSTFAAPLPDDLRGLGEPAIDRALYGRGLQFIVEDPQRFLLLTVSRIDDYYWLLPSAASSVASNLGRLLSFTLYLPFMLYGLYLSRRRWRDCVPLYLYIAFDAALCLLTWAAPRYRLPSDALMMVFAGLAVVTVAERMRERWAARRTSAAGVLAVVSATHPHCPREGGGSSANRIASTIPAPVTWRRPSPPGWQPTGAWWRRWRRSSGGPTT